MTANTRSEESRDSQAFLQCLQMADIWLWDLNLPDSQWADPSLWQALGFQTNEIAGVTSDWSKFIFEEDVATVQLALEVLDRDPKAGFDQLIRARNKKGETAWLKCKGKLLHVLIDGHKFLAVSFVDISEEKRNAFRLHQESIISKCIRDSKTHYVAKADLEGYFTYINKSYAESLNITEAELIGKSSNSFFIDKDIASRLNSFEHCTLNPERPHTVILYPKNNHESANVQEWTFCGLKDVHGVVNEILCLGRELSQGNRMADDKPVHSAGLMLWTISFDGNVKSVSPSWEYHLGHSFPQIAGDMLENFVHAGDIGRTIQAVGRAIKDHTSQVEHRLQHGNGSWIWCLTHIKKNELTSELHFNSYDITDKKLTQNQLVRTSQMLEQTSEIARVGGWEYDVLKKKLYWSKIAREIHEEEPDADISLDWAMQMYISKEDRDRLLDAGQLARTGIPWDIEGQIKTAKGNYRWVRNIGKPQIEHGICVRLYGTLQDVTDRKKIEQNIEKARILAESASKAKSGFMANMSHEIRTPLNGILGIVEMLEGTDLDKTQKEYCQMLSNSSQLLLDIVTDILDFSKLEAGKIQLAEQKTDLEEIAGQCIDVIRPLAQKKNIQLLLNLSAAAPDFVWVDKIRLKQILINLLSNAVKFTNTGKAELLIETISAGDDQATLQFAVVDTGIGVAYKNRKRIFDAFIQEDLSASKRYEGTGLGLAISNHLLGLMNSKLELKSRPGAGSTFSFIINLKAENGGKIKRNNLNDLHTLTKKQIPEPEPISLPKSLRSVMIVEDNPVNMIVTKRMISLLYPDLQIIEAKDGIDGFEKYRQHIPDMILMDIQMPEMNGYDCTRAIRNVEKAGRRVPIIAVTANATDGEAERCFQAGMDAFITKPIVKEHLKSELRKFDLQFARQE
ncbi:response regulator [Dyadobacter luticola]|nr:response regulator [Dyadobacter luticola]